MICCLICCCCIAHQFFEMRSNPSYAQQVLTQLEVATAALVDAMEIELLVVSYCMRCMASCTVVV